MKNSIAEGSFTRLSLITDARTMDRALHWSLRKSCAIRAPLAVCGLGCALFYGVHALGMVYYQNHFLGSVVVFFGLAAVAAPFVYLLGRSGPRMVKGIGGAEAGWVDQAGIHVVIEGESSCIPWPQIESVMASPWGVLLHGIWPCSFFIVRNDGEVGRCIEDVSKLASEGGGALTVVKGLW